MPLEEFTKLIENMVLGKYPDMIMIGVSEQYKKMPFKAKRAKDVEGTGKDVDQTIWYVEDSEKFDFFDTVPINEVVIKYSQEVGVGLQATSVPSDNQDKLKLIVSEELEALLVKLKSDEFLIEEAKRADWGKRKGIFY